MYLKNGGEASVVLLAEVFQVPLLKSELEGGGDDSGGDVVHGAAAVEHARVVEGGHQSRGDLEPSHAVSGAQDLGEGPVRDHVPLKLRFQNSAEIQQANLMPTSRDLTQSTL